MGAKERVSAAGMAIASVLSFHCVHLGSADVVLQDK